MRCGGGHPCAVCVARKEDCVYEKRVDVQKKRGPPAVRGGDAGCCSPAAFCSRAVCAHHACGVAQGQAAVLREENDALKRRIVELERIVALNEGDIGPIEDPAALAAVPAEFASIAMLFSQSRAPKVLTVCTLSHRVRCVHYAVYFEVPWPLRVCRRCVVQEMEYIETFFTHITPTIQLFSG